jgi:four helix bundle protein
VANVKSFRDLVAYQRARAFAKAAREFTLGFPREDRYELTAQIRRAASSVPLNIAEGFGIGTTNGTLRHFRIARGSLFEVDAAFDLASDYGFGSPPEGLVSLLRETDRVLQALIRSMESDL